MPWLLKLIKETFLQSIAKREKEILPQNVIFLAHTMVSEPTGLHLDVLKLLRSVKRNSFIPY